jgi:uncharacterized protein YfaP (DUF2135 family)
MSLFTHSFSSSIRRFASILILCAMVAASSIVLAQQGSQALTPGTPAAGELTNENLAQVFTFTLDDAATINLEITADEGLILTSIITDSTGVQVAQAVDIANSGATGYSDLALEAGTYYLTVFPTAGSDTSLTGAFEVILRAGEAGETSTEEAATEEAVATDEATVTEEAAATTEPVTTEEAVATSEVVATSEATGTEEALPARTFPPQEILSNGIQISLTWPTTSDLNLQVRDPIGRNLYYDSVTTDNGGAFGFDVNGLCEVLIDEGQTATETATWAAGPVATGSYEILVYYRQDCETVGPVTFTVNVTVDGVPLAPIEATLQPPVGDTSTVYLSSFILSADGTAVLGPQGEYLDTRTLPEPVDVYLDSPATALALDATVTGTITSDPGQYYQMYSFDAVANEPLTISMTAQNGNLDTLLLIMDSTGAIIDDNDDRIAVDDTNSEVQNLLVGADGTYYAMATRYGKDVGGTEGTYQITLTGASNETPPEITALNLPRGEIEVLLTWATNADLQTVVRDPVGASVFDDNRTVASGGILQSTGNINCTVSATTPPAYYTYWPVARPGSYEVDVWYQSTCNDNTPVTANLYITVRGETLYQTQFPMTLDQHYVIGFDIANDQNLTTTVYEGGITGGLVTIDLAAEQATPLPDSGTTTGVIGAGNRYDLWTFEGTAGDTVTISMTRQNGSLDTLLYLIGPDGFELASNDDVDEDVKNSTIPDFVLTDDGTYTIVATSYATIFGGTSGNYALTLQVQ